MGDCKESMSDKATPPRRIKILTTKFYCPPPLALDNSYSTTPIGKVDSLRIVSTKAISMPWSTPGSRVLPSSRAEEGATTAP